jgi:hypothetical protein
MTIFLASQPAFFPAHIALGTGTGSAFVELTPADYFRAPMSFIQADASGKCLSRDQISWTPTSSWPQITQIAIASTNNVILMVLNFSKPVTFVTNSPNTIQPGRLSLTLPLPHDVSAALDYDSGQKLLNEIGGSAGCVAVALGADRVILDGNTVAWSCGL